MKYHGTKQKGFTLAELLIVVAIIAVLVGISIPIFTGQLKKAKEAVCEANRRSLLAAYRAAEMTDLDKTPKELVAEAAKSLGATANGYEVTGLCSEGGTYTITVYDDDTIKITCTKHTDATDTYAGEIGSNIIKNISSLTRDTGSGTQSLASYLNGNGKSIDSESPKVAKDSGTTESWTNVINRTLNLSTDKMWTMTKSNGKYVLYLTTGDTKPTKANQTVEVNKYTYDSSGNIVSIESAEATTSTKNSNNTDYIVLRAK
jgi:prepilin-type N-terminal cleavage/methylation domain-containing protein